MQKVLGLGSDPSHLMHSALHGVIVNKIFSEVLSRDTVHVRKALSCST